MVASIGSVRLFIGWVAGFRERKGRRRVRAKDDRFCEQCPAECTRKWRRVCCEGVDSCRGIPAALRRGCLQIFIPLFFGSVSPGTELGYPHHNLPFLSRPLSQLRLSIPSRTSNIAAQPPSGHRTQAFTRSCGTWLQFGAIPLILAIIQKSSCKTS